MIFGFPTLHASGDPYWDKVILLTKFQGANGSTAVFDSSQYADHKTCNTGQVISTAEKKWGVSSLHVTQEAPLALYWSAPRFDRTSEPYTFEGWVKPVSVGAGLAAPALMGIDTSTNLPVLRVSADANTNKLWIRLGAFDSFNSYNFTPGADGWTYWMVRVDGSGNFEAWINTTLVHAFGSMSTGTNCTVWIGGAPPAYPTSSTTVNCYIGETRITKADRYPSGVVALPTEFPVG